MERKNNRIITKTYYPYNVKWGKSSSESKYHFEGFCKYFPKKIIWSFKVKL